MQTTPSPHQPITPSPQIVTQTSISHNIQDLIEAGNRLSSAQMFARASGLPLSQVLAEQGIDASGRVLPGGPSSSVTYSSVTQTMSPNTPVYGYSGGTILPQDLKNYAYSR